VSKAAWTLAQDGLLLSVRLTPKSSRDQIDNLESRDDGLAYIKARVRAAPEDGKANDALIRLLADNLGLGRSAISLTSGATSRLKILKIVGEPAGLEMRLQAACDSSAAGKPKKR
jgi:uncharacterized protein (TIGR00251 family)